MSVNIKPIIEFLIMCEEAIVDTVNKKFLKSTFNNNCEFNIFFKSYFEGNEKKAILLKLFCPLFVTHFVFSFHIFNMSHWAN